MRLPNPLAVDRQPSAFSRLVQLEEGVEGEALVFDFEKVRAARPAAHRVQIDQWSWSSGSPYLRKEKNQWLVSRLQIVRLPLQEPQVQRGPRGEQVLEQRLRGWLCGPILRDAGTRAPQTRLAVGLACLSRYNACLILSPHQL